ncbi:serine hydrolase domain-containing protein [Sphingomonas sp. NPDC092331]|jgi:CubicO group peptidase (beta-lactamase class C family)|uniref:serine hydrolase domain-containing protein n=1 Tax=unclassified Sphingomonas TaxID=196159 RepID=UPI0029F22AC3|nr:beta-lactamase family protein [Pseudomonadota bacterium]
MLRILLSGLLLLTAGCATTTSLPHRRDAAAEYIRATGAPGMVIGWSDGDGRSHIAAAGTASLATGVPVDRRTVFHMASVTKPFVATAILQLAEQGRLDLDASPTRYLPYFRLADPRFGRVTIRQMLNHSSGLPDIEDYEWERPQTSDAALERWVRGLAGLRLVSDPGAAVHYSNLAYDVLGDVIAKASGMPFELYVRRHVLAPLGMRHSSLLLAEVDRRRLSAPHMAEGGQVRVSAVFPYNRVHAGSSTLYADAADMLRWARYWAAVPGRGTRRLLSDAGIAAMLRPGAAVDRPDRAQWEPAIGLGWFLLRVEGRAIAFHMGQDVGFTTGMMVEPGTGRAVVAMSNIATEAAGERMFDLCLSVMTAMQAPPLATRSGPYSGK